MKNPGIYRGNFLTWSECTKRPQSGLKKCTHKHVWGQQSGHMKCISITGEHKGRTGCEGPPEMQLLRELFVRQLVILPARRELPSYKT
jgi:hypothetical protein